MQGLLISTVSLLVGFLIGSIVIYFFLEKFQRQKLVSEYKFQRQKLVSEYEVQQQKLVNEYESKIHKLLTEHQKAIKEAKIRSTDGSRLVIKGKIAEQIAPILPDFGYLPSDARFIGDPIDYIVFNGYSEIKDGNKNRDDLEIVILDVKTGKSLLSNSQLSIAKAIKAGRVRFETVRLEFGKSQNAVEDSPESQLFRKTEAIEVTKQSQISPKAYSLESIRKQHPRAYEPWSADEDRRLRLRLRYSQRTSIKELAAEFQRKPGAIRSRLKKLDLL